MTDSTHHDDGNDCVMTAEHFPHGLRCADCHVEIEEGQRFSQRIEGFIDAIPLTVLTCVPCGLTSDGKGTSDD